jgi:DNA-binding PadR family transcriptional regulator
LADGRRHGYAVKEALREGSAGRFDLPTGTIHPALHRLDAAGLLAGAWSVVDG